MVEWEDGDFENLDNIMAERGAPENFIHPPQMRESPFTSPDPLRKIK